MTQLPISLPKLNELSQSEFVAICGPFFEHSPWVAERTWRHRPFATRDALLAAMLQNLSDARHDEQISLIRAHPDLVGKLAQAGELTRESTGEQSAAGLTALTAEEVELFNRYNAEYHKKFGFPFVICARENKKAAILLAFPVRLANTPEQEHATALTEIGKIAKLRLLDAVSE